MSDESVKVSIVTKACGIMFSVGNQSFRLGYDPGNYEEAQWMVEMLKKALENAGARVEPEVAQIEADYE